MRSNKNRPKTLCDEQELFTVAFPPLRNHHSPHALAKLRFARLHGKIEMDVPVSMDRHVSQVPTFFQYRSLYIYTYMYMCIDTHIDIHTYMYIYVYKYICTYTFMYIRTCAQTPLKTDMLSTENCLTTPCNEQEVSIARVLALWNHHSPMHSHRFALHACVGDSNWTSRVTGTGKPHKLPQTSNLSLSPPPYMIYIYIYVYIKISTYVDTS